MTKTFYPSSTSEANGVHTATNETQLATTDPASTTTQPSNTLSSGSEEFGWLWTTPSTEPNEATWPDGVYQVILDANTADATLAFGLLNVGGTIAGHFGRVNTGLTADIDTKTQAQSAFTGAGSHTASVDTTGSSWGGSTASDRFECLVAIRRTTNHGNASQTFDIDNGTLSSASGPWTVVTIESGVGSADGVFITTAGIGVRDSGVELGLDKIASGDKIIVSGTLGDHGMTIISQRKGIAFESKLKSDCAVLWPLI